MIIHLEFQGFLGADLGASQAGDTLRSILAIARVVAHLHIHGALLQALAALYALVLVALDAKQREVAHGLQQDCYRADVLAECTVVLKENGKRYSCCIIEYVACQEEDV